MKDRLQLRKALRAKRKAISPRDQQTLAEQLKQTALSADLLTPGNTMAVYLANDGEVQTEALIEQAWANNIRVCLPVLHPFAKQHLLFLNYNAQTPMTTNAFGIKEPLLDCSAVVPIKQIDQLFLPLVGFDLFGNRIGMGGGFYDRTLATVEANSINLIGLAHDCQQVDQIPTEAWDIPLDAILTPSRWLQVANKR